MSKLEYNGITVDLTKTLGIAHEVVRDVDNSYLFTRVILDVEGIVNGPPSTSQNPTTPGALTHTVGQAPISDAMSYLRHRLLQERGLLVYSVGDSPTPMIMAPPLDGNGAPLPCDVDNGPVPGPLVITRVDGIKTFHIRFRVSTALLECPGLSGTPTALLSNRSAQSHAIDSNWFTVVTTSGQAFFNTALLEDAQQVADAYRKVLFPPVPLGFKRVSINVIATPSRNALSYQVVDQERSFDLGDTGPAGTNSNITDVAAEYSVASTGQAGAPVSLTTMHSVRVQVWGSKAASNWSLTKAAFLVAQTKLPIGNPDRGFLTQISVNQELTGRLVSLSATMLLNPNNVNMIPGLDVSGLREDNTFANRGGINPAPPNRAGTAGTYANELLVSAWKSACEDVLALTEGPVGDFDATSPYSESTPLVVVSATEDLPTFSPGYSTDQAQHCFTEYKVDAVVETNYWTMQAPITGPAAGSGTSPGSSASSSASGDGSEDDAPPDCEFLTLARPTQRKIVEWTAERVNASPLVPDPAPLDPNLVLIDSGHIQVAEPSLLADGVSLSFRVSGRYVYGLKRTLARNAEIPYPAPPWQASLYGQQSLKPSDYRDGIIDTVTSAATPTPTPTPTPSDA